MKLTDIITLEKPIHKVDLETTGVHVKVDRVVQIGIVTLTPDGTLTARKRYVNPEMPIPKEATDAHGITDAMVRDAPTFAMLARSLWDILYGADVAGYNHSRYDIPLLVEEFARAGMPNFKVGRTIDSFRAYGRFFPRNLEAAVAEYVLPDERLRRDYDELVRRNQQDGVSYHDALFDAECTHLVLMGQFLRHPELKDVATFHKLFNETVEAGKVDVDGKFAWRNGEVVINFGKNAGVPLKRVERSYLQWICNSQFADDTKQIAHDAMYGKYPESPK